METEGPPPQTDKDAAESSSPLSSMPSPSTPSCPTHTPPLSVRNWLNLLALLSNVVVTYAIGMYGAHGGETSEYLHLKYQTLVTPASWAFSIWAAIFLSEFTYVAAQMTSRWRGCALVQDGVGDTFVATCVAQILWTLAFAYEHILLSFLLMLCLCGTLVRIVRAQYGIDDTHETVSEYWLLRFPFQLHGGWVVAASFVNLNVLLEAMDSPAALLIVVGALSLAGMTSLCLASVWYPFKPLFPVGAALTWAVIGVAEELNEPKQSIFNGFTVRTINGFRISAAFIATMLCIVVITRGVKKFMKDGRLANERALAESRFGCGGASNLRDIASDFVRVDDDDGDGSNGGGGRRGDDFVKVDAAERV